MSVSTDIVRSWAAPRRIVGQRLALGLREGHALATLLAGCLLIFVGSWPRLYREASAAPTGALSQDGEAVDVALGSYADETFLRLLSYEFLAWIVVWPLVFYLVGSISHMVLSRFRPALTPLGARFALFWAVLASAPAGLLYGLTIGLIGPGLQADAVGAAWGLLFLWIWINGLRAAANGGAS